MIWSPGVKLENGSSGGFERERFPAIFAEPYCVHLYLLAMIQTQGEYESAMNGTLTFWGRKDALSAVILFRISELTLGMETDRSTGGIHSYPLFSYSENSIGEFGVKEIGMGPTRLS